MTLGAPLLLTGVGRPLKETEGPQKHIQGPLQQQQQNKKEGLLG